MSHHGRYARYESGLPVGDFLAGTVLGLASAAARVSKSSDPVKHVQPAQPAPEGPTTKSVAAQFRDVHSKFDAARETGALDAVHPLDREFNELYQRQVEKLFQTLTDNGIRQADERADEFKCR